MQLEKVSEGLPVAVERGANDLLSVIAQAVADPRIDVEKMERLLAMHERILEGDRKAEFNKALAAVQAKMPQLDQNGRIDYGKGQPIKYAKLEDIDDVIRPIYSAYGFAVAWDTQNEGDGKFIRIVGDFKHSCGHSERRSVLMPIDSSGGKQPIQGVVSTISYGKRTLLKMFFNLIERGTDRDGASTQKITEDQAQTIEDLIAESKANRGGFLQFMKVDRIESIAAGDYGKAINALETKRRGGAR